MIISWIAIAYPLTRLELTLDPSTPYEQTNFPTVYYLNNLQIGFDETLKATETERFILNAVLQGCGTINQLGRRTREKIRALLSRYVKYVEVSGEDYRRILWQLSSYKNGKLPTAATDPDQPPPKKPNIPDWVIEAEKLKLWKRHSKCCGFQLSALICPPLKEGGPPLKTKK